MRPRDPVTRTFRLLLVLTTLTLTQAANAEFRVKESEPWLNERILHVNTRLDLAINPRIEEALAKGIPIDFSFEIRLVRHRWWWRNVLITDTTLVRRLQFHALSRQYLVSSLQNEQPTESFGSLDQALVYLGDLSQFRMKLTRKKEILEGARHLLELRAKLDIESLPVIMRPLAYATPSWRLNTGWTEWPVKM